MGRKTGKKKGGSKPKTKASSSSSTLPNSVSVTPPPSVEPEAAAAEVLLTVDVLRNILRRLSLADLLRAALACHRWRRVAARCLPRAPPLLGYFFHPVKTPPPLPIRPTERIRYDAVFAPLDNASSPRLSLDFAPDASRFDLHDCHHGLVLLEPASEVPKFIHPRLLVLDPATRRRALLPPPPRDTVPDDRRWRRSRHYVGSALLSRAHPSRLCFEAVCFAIDDGHPRAWVASVDDGDCRWRALPRDEDVLVEFDPKWFEGRCVHAAGKLYWHICNSARLIALDPATLRFSYLPAPADLPGNYSCYRIGETPEGRLCVVTVEEQVMRLWLRDETRRSNDGWLLETEMNLRRVYDTVPGLPKDMGARVANIWVTDIDAGNKRKLMLGHGRYSFDPTTRKLERLVTKSGKEYGDPIYAYFLAWPPAFLAQA
ncbi:uncharacterized protein LOC124652867 [Lolium rigidum]|uniref:uncharacterized protein LOC124652867 n=1 Tax=Lolium rigidum TaxID=89674 RepID=UPI001F5DB217|nr:uncharacterized protein LOC124652867 [Lolium rigidum]